MKKKFLVSGAAVFLAVCLLTSALFAFADFSQIYYFSSNGTVLEDLSSLPDPSYTRSTASGGSLSYYASASGYFVFPNFYNYFYYNYDSVILFASSSFPSSGLNVSDLDRVTLTGVAVDSFSGSTIYRFELPNDYPYYLRSAFVSYVPPLFVRVNSFISGFFTAAGDFFDGVMSVPILAILVIGVPVTGLITAITLGLTVGRKKNKSYKKSRRRR